MKHSHKGGNCLVCSSLPPPPSRHRTPTYQKKAPQLLKTHWPKQGLLRKTNSNKLNQWHSLKGASFTWQTRAVSPGRRRYKKDCPQRFRAEKTSACGIRGQRGLFLLRRVDHMHQRMAWKRGGTVAAWLWATITYAEFLHVSSIVCPGSSRPDPLSRARGLLCYWCSSLLLHIMFACTFQVSTWLNKLNDKSTSRIKVHSFFFVFLGNIFQSVYQMLISWGSHRCTLLEHRSSRVAATRHRQELGKGCKYIEHPSFSSKPTP